MTLLDIRSLSVTASTQGATLPIIQDVSLSIARGEAVGLVGESGSGKSMTARSIMRLHGRNVTADGTIEFEGRDVLSMGVRELRSYRRSDVSMIFQDPRAAINPVRTIGAFLTEGLRGSFGLSKQEATRRAIAAMAAVGITRAEERMAQYPHEFSGGMLQRVMICSSLLANSRLLLADEPTTALDVTTQAEVVGLLDDLRRERGLGLLFITHDLDLAAGLCDRVFVMYAGRIVEARAAKNFESAAQHPYSRALFEARPSVDFRAARLPAIPGVPLSASESADACAFAPRCPYATDECRTSLPPLEEADAGDVRCIRVHEIPRAHLRGTAS
ncbi:ABC transporter ATP-binding protein [Microbacterium mangrovi]|uniref:ABC transporter ATP-binding protein n=1 Tax=Microbacterium mangrovi TaxID=1348253 RepID=A0A0B2AB52_9MICO|nr:ABC transporter ATP-binding protein [Microbacterium mangrovi]KHK98807.1 ABC transporter ATP-binding protein [Microbacterium mangrovi]